MSREDSLALVRRLLDAGRRHDLQGISECYTEDVVAISPVFGEVKGRDRVVGTWATIFATIPDIEVTVSDVLVEESRVALLSTISGTDQTGWFGLPATRSAINYRLVLLLTLQGGRIAREERLYDSTGVLERLEKARIDHELHTAADVQRTLLPRSTHRTSFCESVGDSMPCRAIGGDFFEFLDLSSGAFGIAMGDVSGKGPAAALVAALIQGMLVTEAAAGCGPAEIITRMNRQLIARLPAARYATLVCAIVSADGRLQYCNAGHNPPVLWRPNQVQRLTVGGSILGMFDGASFDEETLALKSSDTLVMFTDGVTEARNAADQEFGEDRLLETIRSSAGASSSALLRTIISAVRDFSDIEQTDDITVTVTQMT